MFNWLKKHKILMGLLSIVIILGVPLAIHILFKINSGIPFFEAEWTAGEALGYYGSILSFIGTVVLGILALYQNRLIKEESDKREQIMEQREHERNMPKFTVVSKDSNGNSANLHFVVNNISENNATDIKVFSIKVISPENTVYWQSKIDYTFDCIAANTCVEIKLNNTSIQKDGYIFSMKMNCKDKYNVPHDYSISGIYYVANHFPKFSIEEIK